MASDTLKLISPLHFDRDPGAQRAWELEERRILGIFARSDIASTLTRPFKQRVPLDKDGKRLRAQLALLHSVYGDRGYAYEASIAHKEEKQEGKDTIPPGRESVTPTPEVVDPEVKMTSAEKMGQYGFRIKINGSRDISVRVGSTAAVVTARKGDTIFSHEVTRRNNPGWVLDTVKRVAACFEECVGLDAKATQPAQPSREVAAVPGRATQPTSGLQIA